MCDVIYSRRFNVNDNGSDQDPWNRYRDVCWNTTLELNRLYQKDKKVFCYVRFDAYTSRWVVNTESTYSVININTAIELEFVKLIRQETRKLISYTGCTLDISESIKGELSWGNKNHRAKIIVVRHGCNLIGLEDCIKLSIVVLPKRFWRWIINYGKTKFLNLNNYIFVWSKYSRGFVVSKKRKISCSGLI